MVQATAPDFTGIVVAAGRSARLGGPIPKQFLEIGGRMVVERSIDRLAASADVAEVVVVVAPEQLDGEFAACHPMYFMAPSTSTMFRLRLSGLWSGMIWGRKTPT